MAIRSSNDFDLLAKQVALYDAIETHEAWRDFQYRLSQLREATRSAIERGGVDKFGQRHDDEQRSVLFMLDNLLTYVPSLKAQYAQILASKQQDQSLAKAPVYGDDYIAGPSELDF